MRAFQRHAGRLVAAAIAVASLACGQSTDAVIADRATLTPVDHEGVARLDAGAQVQLR